MADERSPGEGGELPAGGSALARRASRVSVRFSADYTGKSVRGKGTVQNISYTGALIEPAEPPLLAGGRVTFRFSFCDRSLPFEVGAEVVRETENGFAVRFTEMSGRVRNLLKLAIASALARGEGCAEEEEEEHTLLNVRPGGG